MLLEQSLQGQKLERDVLLDTLEEPCTWTSERNYLGGRNFLRFPFSQLATISTAMGLAIHGKAAKHEKKLTFYPNKSIDGGCSSANTWPILEYGVPY